MNDEYGPVHDQSQETEEDRHAAFQRLGEQRRKNAAAWLDSQPATDPTQGLTNYEALRTLIGNPAFGALWGIVRHYRELHANVLVHARLGSAENDSAASATQGHVRAFDELRELLLDIADPRAAEGTSR